MTQPRFASRHARPRRAPLYRALSCALWLGGSLFAAGAFAQDAEPAPQAGAQATAQAGEARTLETVSVLGSRRAQRSSDTTSISPVDVLPMAKNTEEGAQFDLAQSLQYAAPSFNSTRQSGADGADLVDSAALRGLGSDQTLVLVNGKRHHTTALLNLFGARNRGNTGTDLNTIPLMAIDSVEILRDGAAAQYGSDAIAGVMNISLKKRKGCEAVAGYGQYSKGDGENWLASAYCGFGLGSDGTLGITGEWQDRGRSDRSEPAGSPRIIGDSKVKNQTLFLNGDKPLAENVDLYFTLGVQKRDASSAAFARDGIGSEDIPSRNSAAMYPNGFVPFIDGDIDDRFGILGLRWGWGEWNADLSYTYGYSKLRYTINNTLNASLANLDLLNGGKGVSPRSFDAGGFSFEQNTVNFDVNRFYDHIFRGLNLAFGLERRDERYKIFAGEPGSYLDYDGASDGGNAGSQGFPGFRPSDAGGHSRDSWAAYADIEADFSERFTAGVAVRYEDYSDFGNTTTGKLAAGFRATDTLMFRASASTGFRAPSLQQKYFSSTITDFVNGQPVDVVIAPNGGDLANLAGLPALTKEKSRNYTLGLTWSPTADTSLTLDAYRIDIDDRIVLSGRFGDDDPVIGDALRALQVGQAQFFVNSVDTRTEGLDFTFNNERELGNDFKLGTFFALNLNRTKVRAIHAPPALVGREDVLLSERERLFIEQGAPKSKAVLGFDLSRGAWEGNIKAIYFGPQTLGTFSGTANGVPNARYKAKASADLSVTYAFSENTKLTVGGSNILNVKPTRQDPNETDNGHIFDSVQFGLNGAAYFVRLWHRF
ncbi:TonB-dependent receptor plug domain-containing protein [Lysobacter enzymogenes]|uniref:TonB-dependent receptor plug domain-containing protein n=1 Tax=Lysobacter enzymogenes TaxID=69 RepID=UPI00089C587E|nr:TonB-dependent receptor [Lysobacter enzymogenes]SDW57136.1 iron complex outermembrane recepter protein [Lysobacter enzymogenes]